MRIEWNETYPRTKNTVGLASTIVDDLLFNEFIKLVEHGLLIVDEVRSLASSI